MSQDRPFDQDAPASPATGHEDETTAIPSRRAVREHAEAMRRAAGAPSDAPASRADSRARARGGPQQRAGGGAEQTHALADLVADGETMNPREHRQHRAQTRARAGRSCLVLMVVFLIAIGGIGFLLSKANLPGSSDSAASSDYSGKGSGSVDIVVRQGDGGGAIAQTLVDAKVIKSTGPFLSAAGADQGFGQIKPGTYRLRKHMSGSAAVQLMLSKPAYISSGITIREGLWVSEVFSKLSQATGTPLADYRKVNPASLGLPSAAKGNLEGYLFPSTYNFGRDASAKDQLQEMVTQAKQQISELGVPADQVGRVMTVASLVQAETRRIGQDGPKVARVIDNRVADGMPLQFDSTVHFIEGKRGTVSTTAKERASTSRYNTYKYPGLPPGPIDSPGAAAIKAALKPAAGDWKYFVTVNQANGDTRFATTYAQHQQNEAKFRAWCAGHPGKC